MMVEQQKVSLFKEKLDEKIKYREILINMLRRGAC